MLNPFNLFSREWWAKRSRKVTVARTAAMQSKIDNLRTAGFKDSVERDEEALRTLKKKVYSQDKTIMTDLVNFFKGITDEQNRINKEFFSLKTRIKNAVFEGEAESLLKERIEELTTLQKNFKDGVEKIRGDIETVKSRIKDGDFRWAERRMVIPFNRKQELNAMIDEIGQVMLEIESLLQPAQAQEEAGISSEENFNIIRNTRLVINKLKKDSQNYRNYKALSKLLYNIKGSNDFEDAVNRLNGLYSRWPPTSMIDFKEEANNILEDVDGYLKRMLSNQ